MSFKDIFDIQEKIEKEKMQNVECKPVFQFPVLAK